ncbi:MAG: hypothetical protein V3U98_07155 [Acidobacteriota bacterium]
MNEPSFEDQIASMDLSQEFERIDEEKARLRLLADHLGLRERGFRSEAPVLPPPETTRQPAPPSAREDRSCPDDAKSAPAGSGPHTSSLSVPQARSLRRGEGRHARRPALPLPDGVAGAEWPAVTSPSRQLNQSLLERLDGFVPAALFEEMKRERDELFFRLAKLEMERSNLEQLRQSLASMETEVSRLEIELRRRRAPAEQDRAEPLRLCYRRWLRLRRRQEIHFTDYLACRRAEREEP